MTINCSEFNFLIDRKSVFTANDIPSLVAYNKCLTREINTLNLKVEKIDDTNEGYSTQLQVLTKSLDDFKALHTSELNSVTEHQNSSFDKYQSMYDSNLTAYNFALGLLTALIAISGVFAFITIKTYKTREIDKLVDGTLDKIKAKLDQEQYTQALVASAMDSTFVSDRVDSKLEDIADALELRVINTLQDQGLVRSNDRISNTEGQPNLNAVLSED